MGRASATLILTLSAVSCLPARQRSEVRTPMLSVVAWLDSGVIYSRVDFEGVGLGDVFTAVCDSAGLYLTPGHTSGRRLQSGEEFCSAALGAQRASLNPRWRALLFSGEQGPIYRVDLGAHRVDIVIHQCMVAPGEPAWSPDGRRIAFVGNCTGNWDARTLHVANADGSGVTAVGSPGDSISEHSPSWAPDGQHIVVTREHGHQHDSVSVVDLRTGRRHTLAPGSDPSWSPDGDRIAYFLYDWKSETATSLWVIRPDGRDHQLIWTASRYDRGDFPVGPIGWSPDARHLVFARWQGLWTVDVASRSAQQLLYLPQWKY